MDDQLEWQTPVFEVLTDSEVRADEADIPLANGFFSSPPG